VAELAVPTAGKQVVAQRLYWSLQVDI